MRILTKVDKYTIDKITFESKKKVSPIGPITVPVFFNDTPLSTHSHFRVEDGKIAMKTNPQFIDFGFKLYGRIDGPDAIPEMISGFNSFIDSFSERGMRPMDDGIFACVDKIFLDLGYVGKMVKVEGIEKSIEGDIFVYSVNYAETLITNEDYEYQEYQWSKAMPQDI